MENIEPTKSVAIGDAVQAGVIDETGDVCFLDINEMPPGGVARILFRTREIGVFVTRLAAVAEVAHKIQVEYLVKNGKPTDPEPPLVLPLSGVQVRPHTAARGVLIQFHLGSGIQVPIHLTVAQSRQLAESLLRQAVALESTPGTQQH